MTSLSNSKNNVKTMQHINGICGHINVSYTKHIISMICMISLSICIYFMCYQCEMVVSVNLHVECPYGMITFVIMLYTLEPKIREFIVADSYTIYY